MAVQNQEVIQTTLGELIEALTQISLEAVKSEEEGYRLATLALENILSRNENGSLADLFHETRSH